MTKKFSERRRAAFVAGLEETGNHTLAARRAKVSRSWVTLHKGTDPDFRAVCDAAVAAAKVRLSRAEGTAPPARWGTSGGAELVVRGTNGRRVQIAAARVKQWDPGAEQAFLAALAGSCNVKAACRAVGLSAASAYNHRKRHPLFAHAWKAAVEQGYVTIEADLVRNGVAVLTGAELPEAAPIPPMTVDQALQLLHMHKREVRAVGGRPGRVPRRRTMDELRPGIIRKLEAVRRAYGLPPGPGSSEDSACVVWTGRTP